MRFSLRDIFWMTALVAMALGWWLDNRRYDWSIKSAQLRKDYYDLMSDVARSESQKAIEKQKQLSEALRRVGEKAAAGESQAPPTQPALTEVVTQE